MANYTTTTDEELQLLIEAVGDRTYPSWELAVNELDRRSRVRQAESAEKLTAQLVKATARLVMATILLAVATAVLAVAAAVSAAADLGWIVAVHL
jgi:hypothetical protein